MDVERLMRELNIDQLAEIQSNLVTEVEDKKEELRQMVGRRYRDVLDASNCVRKLAEMANQLSDCIAEAHKSPPSSVIARSSKDSGWMREDAIYRFVVLDRLQREIEVTDDSLSDTFVLLLAENLHRFLSVEASLPAPVAATLRRLSPLFMKQRRDLLEHCEAMLGELNDWNETTNVFLAMVILNPLTPAELVDRYFSARLDKVSRCISWSNSLIDVLRAMHDTVAVVYCIFGKGKVYSSALNVVAADGWRPECVKMIIGDQLLTYVNFIEGEILKVNRRYAILEKQIDPNVLQGKCTAWVTNICDVINNQMDELCKHIESTELVVDFLSMASELFRTKWTGIVSHSVIYQRMFGDKLIKRFISLIESELLEAEDRLIKGWSSMAFADAGLLFQKRSEKFDPLLASGVSKNLNELVEKFNGELGLLSQSVRRFEKLGKELSNVALTDQFAEMVLKMVERLTNRPSTSSEEPLRLFRLFLALIRFHPSVLCSSMDRSADKIQQCSRLLNQAAHNALCEHLDRVIQMCENEEVALEQVGVFMIPTQINHRLYDFLMMIANETIDQGVGHLCNKNVREHVKNVLGRLLGDMMSSCADNCCCLPAVCFQLLFDARVILLLFPSEAVKAAIQKIESKLDPFDLSIVSDLISQNAKIAVQRNSLLFGQMSGEPVFPRETNLRESYNQLIDTTKRITEVPRLSLIPRLSKYREMESEAKQEEMLGLPSSTTQPAKSSTTSLSSFYDKISTSWFRKE
ncbi:hypothetical protein QR680_009055 [Steinernema hermaphroditum]|uniref:Conserved oligomeric Golgi complex subunit 1 n=1 Tax=Steinernema hermaphroditum TaxID=289476 RepID=A0AA39IL94_9BILA|nr:hypothetical protein QR680_009055 [Steinernema hermaphroditum]